MTSQTIYILSGIALFIAALIGNLIYTHRELLKKSTISHWHDWEIKAASCLPSFVFLYYSLGNVKYEVLRIICPALVLSIWFLVWFDGLYGLRVANDFFYRGTATGENAAKTDRFFRRFPAFIVAIMKIFACIATLYLYIKMIEK